MRRSVALTSMGNLAVSLRALGDLEASRTLQERVLEVSRRVLGPDHPDTRTIERNLEEIVRAQGGR